MSSLIVPHRSINKVAAAADPKQAILDIVGNLKGIEVIGSRVLLGTFIRPEKTTGGVFLTDSTKEEDVWQGKVGLVLKWGPDAFKNPETGLTYEQVVEVGEWGVYYVGDARHIQINKLPCRLVRDTQLVMKVTDPMAVL